MTRQPFGRHAPVALLVAALLGACAGGGGATEDGAGGEGPTTTAAATTTTTTEPPLPGLPVAVVDRGFSVFPDPIDPTAELGGFGALLENPNPDVLAAGVSVTLRLLDADGRELAVDRSVLNGILPGQRMAVGRTLIEPVEGPVWLEVDVDVAAFLLPADDGGFLATDVVTEPVDGGGAETRFSVASTWATDEEGVDVAALYRGDDGRILAAERTTLPRLRAGDTAEWAIRLLAPIPDLAATEVYVGRGFSSQSLG